jgi:DNA-binding NarL/FixJ family response regulator
MRQDSADSAIWGLVMLVDDNPDELGMIVETLETAGLATLSASSGDAALTLLENNVPDLVVLDAVMPGLDGFATCRRLKAQTRLAHVPVIFMTGLREPENVLLGLAAGGVDYVTKPVNLPELLARIRIHIANGRIALGARTALDIAGRTLIATDRAGRLRWTTPQASGLLAASFPGDGDTGFSLPELANRTLQGIILRSADERTRAGEAMLTEGLGVTYLGTNGTDEHLFRLNSASALSDQDLLRDRLTLTDREAEVLLWIARGKSNREISEILSISPRTVNKHLEQVFVKLGVENRAAGAAVAVRTLTR